MRLSVEIIVTCILLSIVICKARDRLSTKNVWILYYVHIYIYYMFKLFKVHFDGIPKYIFLSNFF